jgi:pimeloyl-ACP methyl ester carboxylesterase
MHEYPVEINWNGNRLLGIYHKSNTDRTVFFIHGMPGDRVDYRRIMVRMARKLQKNGVSSIRMDLFASGVSDGSFQFVTLKDQVSQIAFIIDKFLELGYLKSPPILLGVSEGAKLVMHYLKNNTAEGVCLWNGVFCKESWRSNYNQVKRLTRIDGELVMDIGYGVWINRSVIYDSAELEVNNVSDIPDLPMLGIYGDDDILTVNSQTLLRQSHAQIHLIEGADHLFTNSKWEEKLLDYTLSWVTKL